MKFLSRLLRKSIKLLLAGAFTIIVAACYGVYMDYRYLVSVKNSEGTALRNIRVSLIEEGTTIDRDFTNDSGQALVSSGGSYSNVFDVEIVDVDGSENGGQFQPVNMPVYADAGDMTEYSVTMDLVVE